MSADDRVWIEIVNWDRFQHYRDRQPPWIKNYTSLLHDPDYLNLTGHQRAILHGLWLEYASSNSRVALSTASLTRQLGLRVSSAHIAALIHAGFITLRASKPLALARSREKTPTESSKKPLARRPRKAAAAAAKKTENDETGRDPEALQKLQAMVEQIGLRS